MPWLKTNLPFTLIIVMFALLSLQPVAAQQTERIVDFHSEITIHTDSSMTVTETIRVAARGENIRHGIYRDFPTRYRDRNGRPFHVGFYVKSVTLNGKWENFFVNKSGNNRRVYIGREEVFLAPGEYVYELTYATNRQLGFFDDHDELYWNVTGTEWDFPIDSASASVTFPNPVRAGDFTLAGYTGPYGSTGTYYTTEVTGPATVDFATTRGLNPRENLTILVSVPKGTVTPPSPETRRRFWLADHQAEILGMYGLAFIALIYFVTWVFAGRDPRRGVSHSQDSPPSGLSPAALRYVMRMGSDNTSFTAAILHMATAGYLRLDIDDAGGYTLVRDSASDDVLTPEEWRLARSLFCGRTSVAIDQDNHEILSGARDALATGLRAQFFGTYFRTNRGTFVTCMILTAVLCIAMTIIREAPEIIFMIIFAAAFTGSALFPIANHLADYNQLFSTPWTTAEGSSKGNIQWMLILGAFLIFLGLIPLVIMAFLISPEMALIVLGLLAVNGLFHLILPAYSAEGRRLMNRIGGFRHWLASPASGRYLVNDEAEMTGFEQYLSYAVGLGVQQEWTAQLEDELKEAGKPRREPVQPVWYHNPYANRFDANEFTDSVSDSFTSSFSSASTSPSSSSGGSSGGFSGGGGGGGGGGGW